MTTASTDKHTIPVIRKDNGYRMGADISLPPLPFLAMGDTFDPRPETTPRSPLIGNSRRRGPRVSAIIAATREAHAEYGVEL